MKDYWDYYSTMKTAEDKAEARGRAEGRAEEKQDNARKMKQLGASAEFIAQVTGLTPEEIENL